VSISTIPREVNAKKIIIQDSFLHRIVFRKPNFWIIPYKRNNKIGNAKKTKVNRVKIPTAHIVPIFKQKNMSILLLLLLFVMTVAISKARINDSIELENGRVNMTIVGQALARSNTAIGTPQYSSDPLVLLLERFSFVFFIVILVIVLVLIVVE
jgi:hypothetical protein